METLPGCPQRHRTLPSSPNSPVRAANRIEGQPCDRSYCYRIDRVSAPPSECHDEPTPMAQVEHRIVATWARILSTGGIPSVHFHPRRVVARGEREELAQRYEFMRQTVDVRVPRAR